MFFSALATDYDDTLARNGHVNEPTREALKRVRASGRKLILVTGRELSELKGVFDELSLFDLIVAENGAVLFNPANNDEVALADPVPPALVKRLRELDVSPLSIGHSIIATREPNEIQVLEAIRDLSLEQHIIFNKGAVMVLPININKSFGLRHALDQLGLSLHNVVGIGDAENDQAFLSACGCAVAVGNALPSVKEKCDVVVGDFSAGVVEICDRLVDEDLASLSHVLSSRMPVLGDSADGKPIFLKPLETTLVAGGSGAGKTTLVTAVLEQMRASKFQCCIIDPEGDYSELPDATVLGDPSHPPRISAAMDLLENPQISVVLNLLAIDLADRPKFVIRLLSDIQTMRDEKGRPHWLVLDEVHHYFSADQPSASSLPRKFTGVLAVTVHPSSVAGDFIAAVSTMVALGEEAPAAMKEFCSLTERSGPLDRMPPNSNGALILGDDEGITTFTPRHPAVKQPRHVRKYAEGDLADQDSFYFTGRDGALRLRAKNLVAFLELSEGVDTATWKYHLAAGDYSRWFREKIKDAALSADAASVENDRSLSAEESYARIKEIVQRRYTAPAK